MWRTSCGDRILKGAEARLFAETMLSLLDEAIFDQWEDYDLGIEAFDNLTYGQKASVLSAIGEGLFKKEVKPVELTAVLEAAIAAVFAHLRSEVLFELDMDEPCTEWRDMIVAAKKEMGVEEIPDPTCDDGEEWDIEVQELWDSILWDADYSDGHLYLDRPPEESEELREMARIPKQYYMAIADDLTDKQAEEKYRALRELCTSVVKRVQ